MLGLVRKGDHVCWIDDKGELHYGIIVTLTDDELWADVRELGQNDVTQLPTAYLHAIA